MKVHKKKKKILYKNTTNTKIKMSRTKKRCKGWHHSPRRKGNLVWNTKEEEGWEKTLGNRAEISSTNKWCWCQKWCDLVSLLIIYRECELHTKGSHRWPWLRRSCRVSQDMEITQSDLLRLGTLLEKTTRWVATCKHENIPKAKSSKTLVVNGKLLAGRLKHFAMRVGGQLNISAYYSLAAKMLMQF